MKIPECEIWKCICEVIIFNAFSLFSTIYIFSHLVFLPKMLAIQWIPGKGGEPSLLLSLIHEHLDIHFQFCMRWLPRIFMATHVITKLQLKVIYPPLRVSIWLNINPSRPNPRRREKINLKVLFSHFFLKP